MNLSVIIASSGRPTLQNTIHSITSQMTDGDEVLISINHDAPWGGRARNQLMRNARGDVLLFMDDDDIYADGAFDVVRRAYTTDPGRLHIFCMKYARDGRVLGRERLFACGYLSTQMIVVPRLVTVGKLGPISIAHTEARFSDAYEGDWHFAESAQKVLGDPVFHDDVIALIRPHEVS